MSVLRHGLALDKADTKRILLITMPAMLELVFSQLFGMVDAMMLGRTKISAIAIASVGLTNNPVNLIIGVLSAVNVGATAAVAWAIGADDIKTARAVTRNILVIDLILGIVATLVYTFFARQMVTFMGAGPDTLHYAEEYLKIVAIGFLPNALCMGVTASLRGAGLTRVPMVYNLVSNLLNVIGNYVLIYGKFGFPELSVAGAAISTTFSRYVALVIALLYLFLAHTKVQVSLRDSFRLRMPLVKQIFRVGLPGSIEQAIMQAGFILFARSVASLGTTVMAAHQIGLNINGLCWVPSQAFGVAATTLVGQEMGAKQPLKARDQARMVHRCAMVTSLFVALLFILAARQIVSLYTTDQQVIDLASGVLQLVALGMPGIATQIPIAAALRGARDSVFPLVASALGIWIFRVFVAQFLIHTMGWGLSGAWWSIVLDQTTRAVVVYARFRHGGWMRKGEIA